MTLQAVALFVVFLLTNNYTQLHRNYFLRKPGGRVVNTAGGGGGGGGGGVWSIYFQDFEMQCFIPQDLWE